MKFLTIAIATFVAAPALATDYSACAPTVFPKSRPEYRLDAKGRLVMERKGPDVAQASSGEEQDVYVTRYETKPVKNQVQELNRKNGKPHSLKTYFKDGSGKRVGNATNRTFAYANDRCYLTEVEFENDAEELQVTYEKAFCDRLLKASEGMTGAARDVSRVGKVMADYDASLRRNGRSLFGYEAARMKDEGADVIASVVGTCRSIGASFPGVEVAPSRGSPGGVDTEEGGSAGAN